MSEWIHGETGGYLRVCTEKRNWFEEDFPKWLDESGINFSNYKRSSEHCSYIIEAIETGRVYRGHFNTMNKGVKKSPKIAKPPDIAMRIKCLPLCNGRRI